MSLTQEETFVDIMIRLMSSSVLLVVYSFYALTVLWNYGRILDFSAWSVIIIYLVSIIIRLVFAVYDLATIGIKDARGIEIPNAVAGIFILMVFYYFTYELRLVQLKLESSNLDQFLKKVKQAKVMLIFVLLLLTTILSLRIWSDFFTIEEINTVGSFGWRLIAISVYISLFTDLGNIFLFWFYLNYFFRKKKEFLSKTRGQFTFKEKAIIVWTYVILFLNTINFTFDNYLDVKFLYIENYDFENQWNAFLSVWFALLIMNNGITLLYLYKRVA
jgi:hypothetical protein